MRKLELCIQQQQQQHHNRPILASAKLDVAVSGSSIIVLPVPSSSSSSLPSSHSLPKVSVVVTPCHPPQPSSARVEPRRLEVGGSSAASVMSSPVAVNKVEKALPAVSLPVAFDFKAKKTSLFVVSLPVSVSGRAVVAAVTAQDVVVAIPLPPPPPSSSPLPVFLGDLDSDDSSEDRPLFERLKGHLASAASSSSSSLPAADVRMPVTVSVVAGAAGIAAAVVEDGGVVLTSALLMVLQVARVSLLLSQLLSNGR